MKTKLTWQEQLKKAIAENDDIPFGHNTEVDAEWYIKKIEKLSNGSSEIEILDYYTIRLTLPPDMSKYREEVLLFILTTTPMPTEVKFNKKNNKLTIEWHY